VRQWLLTKLVTHKRNRLWDAIVEQAEIEIQLENVNGLRVLAWRDVALQV